LDLDREKVWVIPSERMKAKRPHEVPLSPAMQAHLETLRAKRGTEGDYVFSNDNGKRPIGNFSQIKTDLDAAIAKIIKEKGHDIAMPAWTFHDIRRTVRTNLGAIPSIPVDVRERVVAHVPPGLVQTYDLHDFRDEKRKALTLWADRLAQIVNPPPVGANVVQMRAAE
jgi:integrase